MSDRSKLKLHTGSRWDESGTTITDQARGTVSICHGGKVTAYLETDDGAYIEDALAVIRAAGLDPEFEELEEANKRIAELERVPTVPKCATCQRFVSPDNPGDRHGWCKHQTLNLETDVPPDGSGYCWRHPEARR